MQFLFCLSIYVFVDKDRAKMLKACAEGPDVSGARSVSQFCILVALGETSTLTLNLQSSCVVGIFRQMVT